MASSPDQFQDSYRQYKKLCRAKEIKSCLQDANAIIEITQRAIFVICDKRGADNLDYVKNKFPGLVFETSLNNIVIEVSDGGSWDIPKFVLDSLFQVSVLGILGAFLNFFYVKANAI